MDNQSIQESDFVFYTGEDGKVHAQVILGEETVWASQRTMADIFGTTRENITYHIKNVYTDGELNELATSKEILLVQKEGNRDVSRNVVFYNLDAIISIGFRISSFKATKFRQWASRVLNEYLTKGFVLDDERLKQGNRLYGKDYFRELLERIREIRTSEKMFYEKITDLYGTSVDYDKDDPDTHLFFAKVQNKLEFAIVGKTSAEIVRSRANAKLPYMGLRTFKNANRDGKVQKLDVTIAKNYLSENELKSLNLLVSAFLDHAEMIANRGAIMKMSDWVSKLDRFLEFNEFKVLEDAGKIRRKVADAFAEKQWEKFKPIQEMAFKSDFIKVIEGIKSTGKIPKGNDIVYEIKEHLDPLSEFDKKLVTALNFNPKDAPKEKSKRVAKPKTKECPLCGKECDKKAKYCDGSIDTDDKSIPCPHIF